MLFRSSTIDAMTDPDKKSQEEIKAAWEKGGVPEVFRYENAKAANNLSRAGDWITENVGHPLQKLWYGPHADYDAVTGATELNREVTKPATPTATPASQPTTAPTTQTQAVTKQAATRDNAKQIAQVHGYEKQDSALLNKAQQLGALAQTEAAVTQTAGDNIVDMLHKRLKDADVDYMELAKRISENEKDLAQERKDGTLTAVLTGVGAALSRAGTLEQKGDRVFTPGIGQILGAGILGGIESSEATDKKYRTGIEKNLEALNALQGLKRATANDLMDAYAAEKQNATLAGYYK